MPSITYVPDEQHNLLTCGPSPWTIIRISQAGFDAARAAYGTTSTEDDQRVYRTLQAFAYANSLGERLETAAKVLASQLTDEQIAEAIECEFSATTEWPNGDPDIVRAALRHVSIT